MLNKKFTSKLKKGTHKGSWTTVTMPKSAEYLGTRGLVRIKGSIDGHPFTGAFMALGDGTHTLPIKADIRKAIGKDDGDSVTIILEERL